MSEPTSRDEFGVHPAASLFPLLTGAALDELVEDIRQKGLIYPIILDANDKVIDGRNRLAACQLAGVEPRFERYTGDDPLSYVVSVNAKRRNLTKPQLAIAAARAWLQAEAEGLTRPNGGDAKALVENRQLIREARKHFAGMFGVSHESVYWARRVLEYSPDLADQVVTGATKLEEAFEEATGAERRKRQEQDILERLSGIAPDLIERIERSEITVQEAQAIFRERDELFREQRRTLYILARDFVKNAERFRNTKTILDLPALLDVEEFETEFRNDFPRGKGELIEGLRRLPEAVEVVDALLRDFGAKSSDRRRR